MATSLELAKNVWWNKLTRQEQEDYLKSHPRSKLKINKRRSRKQTMDVQEEQPVVEEKKDDEPLKDENIVEDIEEILDKPKEEEKPTEAPAEQTLEKFDETLQNSEGVVELDDTQKEQAADAISKDIADKLEPETVLEQLSDEDKDELEDELDDAINDEDEPRRKKKFALTALKLAVKIGVITAGVVLVGATGPMAIFLPEVYGSIWNNATNWSDRTGTAVETATRALHKVMKNSKKLRKHIRNGIVVKANGE